jgi:DUF4097 and DUF4098 domain-containing protein YvlB
MRFHTGNGRITVSVPDSFGAEMTGTTGNGTITSELPLRVQGRISPRRVDGIVGNGGPRLELSTGNGDITLRRTQR